MSTYSVSEVAAATADSAETGLGPTWAEEGSTRWLRFRRCREPGVGAFGLSCLLWEDLGDWSRTFARHRSVHRAAFTLFGTLGADFLGAAGPALRRTPWLVALGLFLTLWEVATAKFAWLRCPFFPFASVLKSTDDLPETARPASLRRSSCQLGGYIVGATIGFVTGVSIGWSQSLLGASGAALHQAAAGHRLATNPFFTFPSSWAEHVLIALATSFPVTVLTWSSVASVSMPITTSRARGKPSFLVLRVAIPAALRMFFVGSSQAPNSSFAVLVVAEMIGVKAGLGWYLQWRQAGRPTPTCTAALIVMSLLCSGAITLLLKHAIACWSGREGVVKW